MTNATPADRPCASCGATPYAPRDDFPIVESWTYLDTAYFGPSPTPVIEAGAEFVREKGTRPWLLEELQNMADRVRGEVARFVNASPEEIAFLYATTEGESVVADALDLRPGDNVVVDELHYKGSMVLYRHLEASRRIQLRIVPHREGDVPTDVVARFIDQRTRLVSVAYVSNHNGFRHDLPALADLAHAKGAYLYVDAIQAFGVLPLDVRALNIDFFAAGTYKWVFGSYGAAPFYVRAELLDRIRPMRHGCQTIVQELAHSRFDVTTGIKKFEPSLLAYQAVHQLSAGLRYLGQIGMDRVQQHSVGLAERLKRELVVRGFQVLTPVANRAPIVSFRNPIDGETAMRELLAARVRVTVRENGTQIRVSPAIFNHEGDVDRFLEVADHVLLNRRERPWR